jgi:hypothetical protein
VCLNRGWHSTKLPSCGPLLLKVRRGVVGNCKLAVISESDLESLYSGGKSGTAGVKMSIKEQGWCNILGHAMKAGFEPPIASQSGIYVLIGVAGKSEQVYISNIVPVEAFKSDLEYPPDEADKIIIALRNLIGARPEGMAPMPVTESLARLTELIGSRPENSTKTVISPFDHVPHY